jgi:hypothetical protein
MPRFWPFGRGKAVEVASEPVEAPATVLEERAFMTIERPVEIGPPLRLCEITRVKGQGEFHSICDLGLKKAPEGAVTIRTGHWVA